MVTAENVGRKLSVNSNSRKGSLLMQRKNSSNVNLDQRKNSDFVKPIDEKDAYAQKQTGFQPLKFG